MADQTATPLQRICHLEIRTAEELNFIAQCIQVTGFIVIGDLGSAVNALGSARVFMEEDADGFKHIGNQLVSLAKAVYPERGPDA